MSLIPGKDAGNIQSQLNEIKSALSGKAIPGTHGKVATAQGVRPYKAYVARVTQTGTTAPATTVMENQLSATPVFARTGTGVYTVTLTGAFPTAKTVAIVSNNAAGRVSVAYTSANVITISTFDAAAAAADAILSSASIEIRVYP
jgi:hypothetical protein